jgi:hypothetical protein
LTATLRLALAAAFFTERFTAAFLPAILRLVAVAWRVAVVAALRVAPMIASRAWATVVAG